MSSKSWRTRPDRRARRGIVVLLALLLAGCASTGTRDAPVATGPPPELRAVRGVVPAAPAEAPDAVRRAWEALRRGETAAARAEVDAMGVEAAATPDAEALRGFLALQAGDVERARMAFQTVLADVPHHPPALVGMGLLAEVEDDRQAALDFHRRALEADPTLPEAAVHLRILQLGEAREALLEGESAEAAGDRAAARSAYERAVDLAPELLAGYLRLAELARDAGDPQAAVEWLRRARGRVGDVRPVLEPLARALQEAEEHAEAWDVALELQEMAPEDPEIDELVARARELFETTSLPEQYRELEEADVVRREDLAALIAIRMPFLADLVEEPLEGVIITDTEGSWAERYIREVVSWKVMQVYQNHAFSPELEVSRQMFAEVAYRILVLIGDADAGTRPELRDVPRSHYFHDEIQAVVGNGILELDDGRFGILERMSGRETIGAVQELARMARRAVTFAPSGAPR